MIIVYDQNMKKKAYLENAIKAGYEQIHNELWTAHFSLPADDPKNAECLPLRYVEFFDENERVELFRITPFTLQKDDVGIITYQCEHVLATLLDDVLFQYHEIGGTGIYTKTVLEYILNKQTTKRWVLGVNEFSRQFLYSWENENLLSALFSIPKPFLEEYVWTYDTTVYPFKINLVKIDSNVQSYVRYTKNMRAITKETDPTELCTRLYCLGYGEGVNQLNIKNVNGGKPYLDSVSISKYGVISRVFVDRRFEHEDLLKARGQALLKELEVPRISYSVNAVDLHQITNDLVDKFQVSTYTRVIDTELNENVKALVLKKSKPNFIGDPGNIAIEIANKTRDIAGSISDLADRTRINEVYSQGATNLDSHDYADNCDPNNPAKIRFFIPQETVRINKMILNYDSGSFRAYSRAIQGGGGVAKSTESGGGSSQTSSSGGGGTQTSSSGGGGYTSTSSGGSNSISTTSGGGGYNIVTSGDSGVDVQYGYGQTETADGHSHMFREVRGHKHNITLPSHTHEVTVNIPPHSHQVDIPSHSHQVTIPSHTHRVDIPSHTHQIQIPDHTHEIEHGIFNGPSPSRVTVKVDGTTIYGLDTSETEINIIPYLSKDNEGKINRGWHEITITPNNLARIEASVITQFFVQSRGGGDY